MVSRLSKIVIFLAVAALLAGCKLSVIATAGGDVQSGSDTRNCLGGGVCVFDVTAGFNETFTATAKPGYLFVKWQKAGTSFLCGDSMNPTCTLTVPNDANGEAIAAQSQFAYLMPVFCINTDGDQTCDTADNDDDDDGIADSEDQCPQDPRNEDGFGCPLGTPITGNNLITLSGKQWAQLDLFVNVSGQEMNAVCPAGVCVSGNALNGYDMTGWRWASMSDLVELFNSYGANLFLDPAHPIDPRTKLSAKELGAIWVQRMLSDGWRANSTVTSSISFTGFTKDQNSGLVNYASIQRCTTIASDDSDCAGVLSSGLYETDRFEDIGGWFYRLLDTDEDGTPDATDTDDDNDGVLDTDDQCPLVGPNLDGFGCSAMPITGADVVSINGIEWAQVYLFEGVARSEIAAACPAGQCTGVLNGYDMSGWKWATANDVYGAIAYRYIFPTVSCGGYAICATGFLFEPGYPNAGVPYSFAGFDARTGDPSFPYVRGHIFSGEVPDIVAGVHILAFYIPLTALRLDEVCDPACLSYNAVGAWFHR